MRLSKLIAMSGMASRREAEQIILSGRVKLNGSTVNDVITFINKGDEVLIDEYNISGWLQEDFVKNDIKIWLFNKPRGVITSRFDPQGRITLFSLLPQNLQKLISVGRLDYNTEGLILLTNNGNLARYFELPKNSIERVYRCKVFGQKLSDKHFNEIRRGVTVQGINYGAIKIKQDSDRWYTLTLKEGKNREIRRIFEHYKLQVTRLIRIAYGEFKLLNLQPNETLQVCQDIVSKYKSKL